MAEHTEQAQGVGMLGIAGQNSGIGAPRRRKITGQLALQSLFQQDLVSGGPLFVHGGLQCGAGWAGFRRL